MNLKDYIAHIPDFPKPDMLFYDISPLLLDAAAYQESINRVGAFVQQQQPDLLVGIDSRGFLVAAPLAYGLGIGFLLARKKGKLPGPTLSFPYTLEYNTDAVEIQANSFSEGSRILILDDVLATGGTAQAVATLLTKAGAQVLGFACLIELSFLKGREKLPEIPVFSVIQYDS